VTGTSRSTKRSSWSTARYLLAGPRSSAVCWAISFRRVWPKEIASSTERYCFGSRNSSVRMNRTSSRSGAVAPSTAVSILRSRLAASENCAR
jgi:hypothetical protein